MGFDSIRDPVETEAPRSANTRGGDVPFRALAKAERDAPRARRRRQRLERGREARGPWQSAAPNSRQHGLIIRTRDLSVRGEREVPSQRSSASRGFEVSACIRDLVETRVTGEHVGEERRHESRESEITDRVRVIRRLSQREDQRCAILGGNRLGIVFGRYRTVANGRHERACAIADPLVCDG